MVILYTSNKGNFINLKNITISEMESKGIKKNIYVNLTNRCPCACTFCLRATKKMSETNSLWLEKEPTAEEFYEITKNKFGIESYDAMKKFAVSCKSYIPNVVFTVVDCIGEDDIKASQKVCDDLGIKLRVRPFE